MIEPLKYATPESLMRTADVLLETARAIARRKLADALPVLDTAARLVRAAAEFKKVTT